VCPATERFPKIKYLGHRGSFSSQMSLFHHSINDMIGFVSAAAIFIFLATYCHLAAESTTTFSSFPPFCLQVAKRSWISQNFMKNVNIDIKIMRK
jgi:hypothetical protein